jgi:hypothetical protein
MPFLRAAKIERELNSVLADAKNVGSKDFQEKVKEAVREMKHMNNLLSSIELILSGM